MVFDKKSILKDFELLQAVIDGRIEIYNFGSSHELLKFLRNDHPGKP